MTPGLLVDIRPAVGGHGQRGIGRYVRGLAASIAGFPEVLAERIWAIGYAGAALDLFGARSVTCASHDRLDRMPMWVTGQLAVKGALRRSGARALHATDPQQPWTGGAAASIVTVYDLIPLRERELLQSWRLDHRILYRRYIGQIRSAERIIAISRTTADDLRERLGIQPERIDVVYPSVTTPRIVCRHEPPEPTFLFVGALDLHKQPELAMRSFALFRSRMGSGRLRYIGPPDVAQERRLLQLAGQLGVAGSISFEGRISDEDLEGAFGTATALVSTSRMEGFGLPPVEAILRGVPVVAVRTPAALEMLSGAATIVPADPEAIADAMSHPDRPSGQAMAAIRERFSAEATARSLVASYRRILA